MGKPTDAPPSHADTAADVVPLDPDHPGFRDAEYRERRNAIAKMAFAYRPPAPVPEVAYTPAENEVWRTVWKHLAPLHARYATREYVESSAEVDLARDRVPQLREVNTQLARSSGFSMLPVAGLISARSFLTELGKKTFLSTQYMRHPSVPLYTPEPDVVHELVGHASTLAHPTFVDLNRAFGAAATHVSDEGVKQIERVYWYSLEFGLARENGQLKTYGAGLLSSFGELGRVENGAKLVPWNTEVVARTPYDPTQYQGTLFVAEQGFKALAREIIAWLDEVR